MDPVLRHQCRVDIATLAVAFSNYLSEFIPISALMAKTISVAVIFLMSLVNVRGTPNAVRPYRVPGYPWTPIVFIAGALALVTNTIAVQPARSAIGIGIVAAGIPANLA